MKMLIGGKKVDARDGKVINITNKATGEVIDTVPNATKEDVAEAIQNARKGYREWSKVPLYARCAIFKKYIALVDAEMEKFVTLLSTEMGRITQETAGEMIQVAVQFGGFVEVASHLYGKTLPVGVVPGRETDLQMVIREPLGVVAAIIPFNAPIELFVQKVAPALIMGNSVIVKPSSDCPLAIIRLVELLVEAGVPSNAVQVVTGSGGTVGTWLVEDPGIAAVCFTGSTETGIDISRRAAQNLTSCFLELGGNDCFIVLEDADMELAVTQAAIGRTVHAGQICAAPKRFIVHKNRVDEFTRMLIEKLSALKIGDPLQPETQMGCLVNEAAVKKIEQQLEYTIGQGAKLLYGGKRMQGLFFEPTVLGNVTKEMDIARDMEVFGPVFPIIAFDTVQDAIDIANNTIYGLSGCVFSQDYRAAMRVASAVETGAMVINSHSFYLSADMPFGGCKMSGKGREGQSVALQELSREKTISMIDFL